MITTKTYSRCKVALSKDVPIAEDNIRFRAERTAVCVMKHRIGVANNPYMRKAFYDLLDDLDNFDVAGYVLTESYEMVQEAIVFLCGHLGKRMSDLITDRKGGPVTILCACFRVIGAYVQGKARKSYKSKYIEDIPEHKFKAEFEWDIPEPEDYTGVNRRIEAMRLTPRQREVLSHRMLGKSVIETAHSLSLSENSIRGSLKCIRNKYHGSLNNKLYNTDIDGLKLTACQRKVVERYLRGERLSEIAKTLSVTRQAIYDAVRKVRRKIKAPATV